MALDRQRLRLWGKRVLWAVLLLVLGGYVLFASLLYSKQRDLIYPLPLVHRPQLEPARAAGVELWEAPLPDASPGAPGLRYAYFWRAEGLEPGHRAPLVVYTHGNGEVAEEALEAASRYHRWGFHVLVPEYRGYGRAAGSPSQAGIVEDAAMFLSRALERPDVEPAKVIFHGYSLGGGVACALSRRHAPAAMILQSTFTGIEHIAKKMLMPPFLVKDPYDNLEAVRQYQAPLLVIHGRQDNVLPFEFGQQLAAAAPNAQFFEHQGDHVSVSDPAQLWAQIRQHVGPWLPQAHPPTQARE